MLCLDWMLSADYFEQQHSFWKSKYMTNVRSAKTMFSKNDFTEFLLSLNKLSLSHTRL